MISSRVFCFNVTATTEIYTLSLHDALPIFRETRGASRPEVVHGAFFPREGKMRHGRLRDRKSTRLNSSHGYISYAVFCLKKKTIRAAACRADEVVVDGDIHGALS